MTSASGFHDQAWQVALAGASFGLGIGLAYASMTSLIVQNVPMSQTGAASGMNANIRTIGGSIGAAVMAGIITAHHGVGGFPAERGYTIGFVLLGLVMALASLAALRIPSTHVQPTSGHLADAADGELGLVPAAGAVPPRG